jgi:hypothetical protein
MNETFPAGRYEFRIFGDDLSDIAERIINRCDASTLLLKSVAEDRYIISPGNEAYIVKIRDHTLDVKQLRQRNGNLEQWQPLFKHPFPLPRTFIADELFPLLHAKEPPLHDGIYSETAFLDLLAETTELQIVTVTKERRRYSVGGISCDIAHVSMGERRLDSICCEGDDPDAIEIFIETIGIEELPNRNYPSQIRAMTTP